MRIALQTLSTIAVVLFVAVAGPLAFGQAKYKVTVEELKPQATMAIKFEAAREELAQKFGEVFGALYGYVMGNGGELAGAPYGRYLNMTEEKFEVEAGLPVKKALAANGNIKPSQLPGGAVATTIHVGPYEGLGAAHEALETWVRENGKEPTGPVWEEYLNDPGSQADPSKYETQLFQPIKGAKSR